MPKGNPIRPAINPFTDIPIPDDVYIEEQYEDILKAIDIVLPHCEAYDLDNHHPVGRLKGELLYLQQEVRAKRFPIPNSTGPVSTIYSLAGEPMFPKGFPNIKKELYTISSLVTCTSLIKPRHYPRVIELIDDVIVKGEAILKSDENIKTPEKNNLIGLLDELKKIARLLFLEKIILPLGKDDWPCYGDINSLWPILDKYEDFYDAHDKLSGPFTSRWRPRQSQPTPSWVMPDWVKEPSEG